MKQANVIAIIQARMGSTRLPGKVLLDLAGKSMLARVVERAQAVPLVNKVIIATTNHILDNQIELLCKQNGWICFRGSEEDVLDRYYQAAKREKADHIVRLTADTPLFSVRETNRLIEQHLKSNVAYTHNLTVFGSGMPLGTGSEIFTFAALEQSWQEGQELHHREHVDEYIYENPHLFEIAMVPAMPELCFPELRLTVDTPEDLTLMQQIYQQLCQPSEIVKLSEVISLLRHDPELKKLNSHVLQKRY